MIAIFGVFICLLILSVPIVTSYRKQRRAIENFRAVERERSQR